MSKHLHKLFALVLVCCAFLGSSTAWGQTNPTPQDLPFSTDFSSMGSSTTLPTGIATWLSGYKNSKAVALTSTATGDAPIMSTAAKQTGGANVYNFTAGSNNRLYIQLSSNTSNGSNQIAAAINTTGKSGVKIAYSIELINDQPRPVGITVQYRIGTSGNWTEIPNSDYSSKGIADGGVVPFTLMLPVEAENKPIVQLRWVTYENVESGATGSRDGIALDNIVISEEAAPSGPSLKASTATLDMGEKAINSTFQGSYLLSAKNIAEGENVTVTADAPFTISTSETDGYTNTLTFTGDDLATDTRIYVRVKPATIGEVIGNITHTAKDATDVIVALKATASSPFAQNFDNCGTTLPGGWSAYSVTGDQVWGCTTYGRTGNAVQLNGFANSKSNNNEDWLISPALDLTATNIPVLSFWTISAFNGPALKVMVSTNYDGTSAPSTATWTELNVSLPAVGSDTWTQSEFLLDQYKQSAVYVAFVYTSKDETNGASRWTVDDFSINDESTKFVAGNASFDFGAVAAGSSSAAQTVTFKAIGFTEAFTFSSNAADFEVSKDNATFGPSATYTAAEAAAGAELFVRFSPKSTALRIEGTLKVTSGSDFEKVLGTVRGTSMLRSATLDVVTWNMEWFGADKDEKGAELGPADEALQYANAKKVFTDLDADILALQEVS
ncbi:MAG TPA: choice-of-anchor J domain-containing protein, partial [Pontibacter sp.]